jgi:tetratricopeptide (TPR) repeat protein
MHYTQAHKAFRKAFLIAQELYDPELMSSALAREGIILNQQENPTEAIVRFNHALETIKYLGYVTLEGYILQALSEAQAKVQQSQECLYSIGLAEDTLGQIHATPERSLTRLNISSLTAQRGVNAALLRDYEQAIKLIDTSLTTYDPTLIRGRARLIAQKAEVYYWLSKIEECTTAAKEAFALADSVGASKTVGRVNKLHTTLTQSRWGKEQGVAQLGMMLYGEK